MKSSPDLGPIKAPPSTTSQAAQIQRAMMNRQQAARTNSASGVPLLQPVNTIMQSGRENAFSHAPPYTRNLSQTSSPSSSRPPGFAVQRGLSSPTSTFSAQHLHQQQRPQHRPQRNPFTQQSSFPRPSAGASATQRDAIPGKSPINPRNLPAASTDWYTSSYEEHRDPFGRLFLSFL